MDKDWLIGFVEGEGNFHILLSRNFKTATWKYSFEFYPILQFRIFLREDDRDVLEKIQSFLGFGKIYKKNLGYSRKKGINSRDQCAYYVTSSKELYKLKELFLSSKFYSKKKKDMETFFQILDMKNSKQHLSQEGYQKILKLTKEINSKNRDSFKVKRSNE